MNIYNLCIKNYSNIIFDCDGVILDSIKIKENNISKVGSNYLHGEILESFLTFFNDNPGLPREIKIDRFIDDGKIKSKLLHDYKKMNLDALKNANLSDGLLHFLNDELHRNIPKFIVSGGDQSELLEVMKYKGLSKYFTKILGGPKSKYENINTLNINGNTLYFGDSKIDYEVCEFYSLSH